MPENDDDKSWMKGAGHPSKALRHNSDPNGTALSTPGKGSQWPPAPTLTTPARPYSGLGGFPQPGWHVVSGFVILGGMFGALYGAILSLSTGSTDFAIAGAMFIGILGTVIGAVNGIILGIYVALKQPATDLDFKLCGETVRKWPLIITIVIATAINFCFAGPQLELLSLFNKGTIVEYLCAGLAAWIAGRIVAAKFGD